MLSSDRLTHSWAFATRTSGMWVGVAGTGMSVARALGVRTGVGGNSLARPGLSGTLRARLGRGRGDLTTSCNAPAAFVAARHGTEGVEPTAPILMVHGGTMLCRRCSATPSETLPPDLGALGVCAVAGVLCARCGAVLGPDDLTARLFLKLAQLNRFGL